MASIPRGAIRFPVELVAIQTMGVMSRISDTIVIQITPERIVAIAKCLQVAVYPFFTPDGLRTITDPLGHLSRGSVHVGIPSHSMKAFHDDGSGGIEFAVYPSERAGYDGVHERDDTPPDDIIWDMMIVTQGGSIRRLNATIPDRMNVNPGMERIERGGFHLEYSRLNTTLSQFSSTQARILEVRTTPACDSLTFRTNGQYYSQEVSMPMRAPPVPGWVPPAAVLVDNYQTDGLRFIEKMRLLIKPGTEARFYWEKNILFFILHMNTRRAEPFVYIVAPMPPQYQRIGGMRRHHIRTRVRVPRLGREIPLIKEPEPVEMDVPEWTEMIRKEAEKASEPKRVVSASRKRSEVGQIAGEFVRTAHDAEPPPAKPPTPSPPPSPQKKPRAKKPKREAPPSPPPDSTAPKRKKRRKDASWTPEGERKKR